MRIPKIMSGRRGIFLKRAGWVLFGLAAFVLAATALLVFVGHTNMYIVRSDSMKPVFGAGDLVFIAPIDGFLGTNPQVGSIVTYRMGEKLITHRVVEVTPDGYRTKGDSNENVDPAPISEEQLTGRYLFKLPKIGHVSMFIKTRDGWFLGVFLPAGILIALIAIDIVREALKKDRPAVVAADAGDGSLPGPEHGEAPKETAGK